jgi:hypothetical protein
MSNKITINGKTIEVEGNNISVSNGVIKVDGKVIETGLTGTVKVRFEGDLANLECADAKIIGNVHGNVNSADLKCGDVGGNVNAADVKCGNVAGRLNAAEVKMRK